MNFYEIMQTVFLLIAASIILYAVNRINKSGEKRAKYYKEG